MNATGQHRALPPEGWSPFGVHVDDNVPLRFSTEVGEDGLPLWERIDVDQVRRDALTEFVLDGVCLFCDGEVLATGEHIDPKRHAEAVEEFKRDAAELDAHADLLEPGWDPATQLRADSTAQKNTSRRVVIEFEFEQVADEDGYRSDELVTIRRTHSDLSESELNGLGEAIAQTDYWQVCRWNDIQTVLGGDQAEMLVR